MADEQRGPWLIPKFHFEVTWGDVVINCSEVSGLSSTVEPIEYRDGKSPFFYPQKRPGLQKFGDITLNKAIFKTDTDFWNWYNRVELREGDDGEEDYREDVTIVLKDENGNVVITWTLLNAWVTSFTMPDMSSLASEAATESITLVCEHITETFEGE